MLPKTAYPEDVCSLYVQKAEKVKGVMLWKQLK